jgi:hypothetical protein
MSNEQTPAINAPSQTAARIAQERERDLHRQHLREEAEINTVFEQGPRLKVSNAEALRMIGAGVVRFDADGVPLVNGIPLSTMLENLVKVNPHVRAEAWQETYDQGASSVKSKADLKTAKEKSDYIAAHGEMAWSRLPLSRQQTQEVPLDELTAGQYKALPTREKIRIIAEKGEAWVGRLMYTAGEEERQARLIGKPRGK